MEDNAGDVVICAWSRRLLVAPPLDLRSLLGRRQFYAWLLIAAGAALRLRQYFEFLSMGNDEAALSRNIAERTFLGLTQQLEHRQSAPILFLFIQKLAIVLGGNQDYVLAIFPLLAGLLSLYFFYRITDRYLGWAGLVGLYAFAFSRQIINYSSIQKQYSSDILVAVLIIYLYDRIARRGWNWKSFTMLGATGTLAIWLSHPALFILPAVGIALLLEALHHRNLASAGHLLVIGAAWALSLLASYFVSLRSLAADPYFTDYWMEGFLPLPPWAHWAWFLDTFRSLLYMNLNRTDASLAIGWLAIWVAGLASLLRSDSSRRIEAVPGRHPAALPSVAASPRSLGAIILHVVVLSLLASTLHLYPLRFRLLLYSLPFSYILLAEGLRLVFSAASRLGARRAWIVSAALAAFLLWPSVVDAKRTLIQPVRLYDMRGIVQSVQRDWRPGDGVLVSGGGETFAYYSGSVGLPAQDAIVDANHRIIRYRSYLQHLDRLSTHPRVWVIFAHFEEDPSYERYSNYLEKQGSIEDETIVGFARAYLWIPKQRLPGAAITN